MDGFVKTPAGDVPRIRTTLSARDHLGTIGARTGTIRSNYRVVPGLYCVGTPTADSPVLVTANYKLSFDALRKELDNLDAWILVADTRGINVWCAAGKGLFSTEEIICSVVSARLPEIVAHRELILPQLGATGVAAHKVKKGCGFSVSYGPVYAKDLPRFIEAGNKADDTMRTVTFSLKERAELIPVEIFLLGKPLVIILLAGFILSGFGPNIFSLSAVWTRGVAAATATLFGILTGCFIVPLFLNQLPWRQFWPKGALAGLAGGLVCTLIFSGSLHWLSLTALVVWTTTVSAYLAMNFTGSTPFTSPSGVEAEMRRGIPIQAGMALAGITMWLISPFLS